PHLAQRPTIFPTTTPLPTIAPPATITPAPTSAPVILTVAIPNEWTDTVTPILQTANQTQPTWQWELLATDDPASALANGTAEVALLPDTNGTAVWREPLTLAVPFTHPRQNLTQAEADTIIASSHPDIRLIPWTSLTPEWRALPIDGRFPPDADYPYQRTWSLVAQAGPETAVATLAAHWQTTPPPWQPVHLAAVGDIMLDRGPGYLLTTGDLAFPFAHFADELAAADLTLGNLESALGDTGQPEHKSYTFRAPPEAAKALALAGFDLLTLANNHALDFGPEALQQGIALLQAQGIATIGAGSNEAAAYAPFITTVNNVRIAFLGYVNVPREVSGFDTAVWTAKGEQPGVAWGTPTRITADVTAVRPQVDVVVVVLHSGFEYIPTPSPPQQAAAEAAIMAGADLVIGHHAHILQGIAFRESGVIVYGLGNFVFQIDGPPETAVLHAWLDKTGLRQLTLTPAIVQPSGQPRPATPTEAQAIHHTITRLTTSLNQP
ncbi:MAG: CapA family protein, partial [Chloroflexi bacterium]